MATFNCVAIAVRSRGLLVLWCSVRSIHRFHTHSETMGSKSEGAQLLKNLKLETEESRRKGLEEFKPQPTDIFVVTPPKCGTTWMQQIIHGLRSGGSMDFDCIENVIPHIEMAHDYGYTDLNKDQGHFPRVYKTHSWFPHCPKGAGKYVFVVRDPERAGVSHYNFFNGWLFDKDSVSVDDFLESVFLGRGAAKSFAEKSSNWDIVASWYPHRNDPNVLWLHYEDMVQDLPACIELVSKFLGIGVGDAELLDLVVKQSSFEFMRTHWEKFDDRLLKVLFNSNCGRPPTAGIGGENAKVSKGNRAPVKFSDAVQEKLNLKWDATVKSVSGYANYKEMREGVNKEFGRKFGMKRSEV